MSLIYNATFDSQTRVLSLLDKAGNVISSCEVPSKELVDDITKPLTFRATQDGSTVTLSETGFPSGAFQTSRDGGNTWVDYTLNTSITLNTGDEVSFRAKADRTADQSNQHYFYFKMTGRIEAWHNVMSLYRTSDFSTYESVMNYAFYCLFNGCTSLVKAPALPATTLDVYCYREMFYNCTSLTKSPALQATTLGSYCYDRMFFGCSSLNEVRCKVPSSYSSYDTEYWLDGVSSTGTFYTNADANWPSGSSGIPEGWNRVNEEDPTVDDITKPLTFRATQDDSTVKLRKYGSPVGDFQTSRDGGKTWTDYTLDDVITLNIGDEVSFRAKADRTADQSNQHYFYFRMMGKIEAWHNVMSLYRTNDFATYKTAGEYSFYHMFDSCTSLVKAPILSATTLDVYCYEAMFVSCTSLTKAPELPATTLANYCYQYMFEGCTSLTKAPELPATTLANYCYYYMFEGCTSLTEAPVLPATQLSQHCYQSMFSGCTSLVNAPELPATTLADDCYVYMFSGCSSLNEVRCKMPSSYGSSQISSKYSPNWLSGVSSTGTFYTNADAKWPSGDDGIPEGWTRVNT